MINVNKSKQKGGGNSLNQKKLSKKSKEFIDRLLSISYGSENGEERPESLLSIQTGSWCI